MATVNQRTKQEHLRQIRELCGYIIHQTHSYLNDGVPRRFDLIEMELSNIQDYVNKLRKLEDVQSE